MGDNHNEFFFFCFFFFVFFFLILSCFVVGGGVFNTCMQYLRIIISGDTVSKKNLFLSER